jgi:predicted nucleic acid-binding protein
MKRETILEIVKRELQSWNPAAEPVSEGSYERQARSIAKKIGPTDSAADVAHTLSAVLTAAFEKPFSAEDCATAATHIHDGIHRGQV